MRQTEEDEEALLTPRVPPDPFGDDLDWDESDRVISGIPIPRSCNVNIVKRAEDYRTSLRGQVKIDERSALLPRLSESAEAPAPIASGRQSDCVPTKCVPTKSVPDEITQSLGQSTFCQTVSRRPPPAFETSDLEPSFSMAPPC